MNLKFKLPLVIFSSIFFTLLFYEQSLGLNLLLFETLFIGFTFIFQKTTYTKTELIVVFGVITTLIASVINFAAYTYTIHFITLFIWVGFLNTSKTASIITSIRVAGIALWESQIQFLKHVFGVKIKGKNLSGFLWKIRIFLIPLFVIFVFIIIYSASNPIFNEGVDKVVSAVTQGIIYVFEDLNVVIVFTFFLAILISNFLFLRISTKNSEENELFKKDDLKRTTLKKKRSFKIIALKNEYKAGVFLFVFLNTLLAILNAADIYWVWFNFEWEGHSLKQFVHEGTYLLIFSIIISIILVLFFFRKNLNFYPNNRVLKFLAYAWIIQNTILVVSVFIRNTWYINYFNLAYKRIGVYLFLAAIIYGLFTVFIKIRNKKTNFYLLKKNSLAIFIILVFSSLVNWDVYIAKYNFNHFEKSYLHLDWLQTLSNKSLPVLNKTTSELKEIEVVQRAIFTNKKMLMDYKNYEASIENRIKQFKLKWESKSFLSWNYAEYKAYKQLFP